MESNKRSKFLENIQELESIVIEEYKNVEILISSQDEGTSSDNLFLKGDFVLNNDRVFFKGLHRMEYFSFYIKIYNFLSITRSSDYIVFSISDLANVIQNHLIHRHKIFDSNTSKKSLEMELSKKVHSHLIKKRDSKGGRSSLLEQFKSGKEFELIGDFQIRLIMRDRVILTVGRSGQERV